MFWPLHLAIFYAHPGDDVSRWAALGAGLLLTAITFLVMGPGRPWPYLTVGWLWYLGTLAPVIGLVQVGEQAMADRYTYVPLIGIFLMLTWGVADLAHYLALPRFALPATFAAVACVCVGLTCRQLTYWNGSVPLWEHALATTQESARAHLGLGAALGELGRPFEACSEYRKAARLAPWQAGVHNNLAIELNTLGQMKEARAEYQKAIDRDPTAAGSHFGLGMVLRDLGLLDEAAAEFRRAIALDDREVQARGAGSCSARARSLRRGGENDREGAGDAPSPIPIA